MLGIEWHLSVGTCTWLLECQYRAVLPPPHTHNLEGPTYKSRGVLVSRVVYLFLCTAHQGKERGGGGGRGV